MEKIFPISFDELLSIFKEYETMCYSTSSDKCASIFSDKYEFLFRGQKFSISKKKFFDEDDISKLAQRFNIALDEIEYLIERNRKYGYV